MDENVPFRVYEFGVPLGFRTSLGPGTDAKEDDEILPVGAAAVAESDPSPLLPISGTNTALGYSAGGRVYRVNDRRGLLFTGRTGITDRRNQRLVDQWIDQRFQAVDGIAFTAIAQEQSIAIAAPKTTDVLRIRPNGIRQGLSLDALASRGAVKAAYYSAAFIIRSVAAERLDTDPEEFDVSNVRQVELDTGERAGEIVLNDHLSNGAGFVHWLAENWSDVLASIVGIGVPEGTFIGDLVSSRHRSRCDSSGYDCLRQYRNMTFHGLLDWRLGLSLLRTLHSIAFSVGLNGSFAEPDLADWPELAQRLRTSFCQTFGCTPRDFGALPGFEVGLRSVVVVHPLWETRRPTGLLAEARAEIPSAQSNRIVYVDTFNLLRRQSWTYQRLAD
jgi:hypothetical protein